MESSQQGLDLANYGSCEGTLSKMGKRCTKFQNSENLDYFYSYFYM